MNIKDRRKISSDAHTMLFELQSVHLTKMNTKLENKAFVHQSSNTSELSSDAALILSDLAVQ